MFGMSVNIPQRFAIFIDTVLHQQQAVPRNDLATELNRKSITKLSMIGST